MHGGANARPFVTHINAYDMPLYLRIAPELYLKRLLVGGVERVFEINRNFRNEGADSSHNPEFTMLEMYEAYGDYDTMRLLTQQLVQDAAIDVFGEPVARRVPAGRVDRGVRPVRRLAGQDDDRRAVGGARRRGRPRHPGAGAAQLLPSGFEIEEPADASVGMLLEELYVELVESKTTTPVFYKDFPKENAPLTRVHRDDPRLTEKWDLVGWGAEMGTGYSELIDPDRPARAVRRSRRLAPSAGTTRRCGWTRTSCARSSTGCHRRAVRAWASTGWS